MKSAESKEENNGMKNYLILCIDLDEWYHGRWATGSSISRWTSVQDCLQDYYKSNKPAGEIVEPTYRILDSLKKEGVKATFFILGEVAEWYPDLVSEIAQEGHEIACHGMYHRDPNLYSRQKFSQELVQAKLILERLAGRPVIGYRAPNLIITKWLHEVLIEQRFLYDSSMCPGREIQGKYKGQSSAPNNPYRIDKSSLCLKGDANLIEIPIPVFPLLKLPGAVSIATRIFGWIWTSITLYNALRTGAACYYMHPYEFNEAPKLQNMSLRQRVFFRRTGAFMENILQRLLNKYRGRIVSAEYYVLKCFNE